MYSSHQWSSSNKRRKLTRTSFSGVVSTNSSLESMVAWGITMDWDLQRIKYNPLYSTWVDKEKQMCPRDYSHVIHSCRGNSLIWQPRHWLGYKRRSAQWAWKRSKPFEKSSTEGAISRYRQSIVAVTCVMDSLKDDIAKMERCLETVSVMTDGWEALLQGSVKG